MPLFFVVVAFFPWCNAHMDADRHGPIGLLGAIPFALLCFLGDECRTWLDNTALVCGIDRWRLDLVLFSGECVGSLVPFLLAKLCFRW